MLDGSVLFPSLPRSLPTSDASFTLQRYFLLIKSLNFLYFLNASSVFNNTVIKHVSRIGVNVLAGTPCHLNPNFFYKGNLLV